MQRHTCAHRLEGHGGKADDSTEDAGLVAARTALHRRLVATRGNFRLGVLRLGLISRLRLRLARGLTGGILSCGRPVGRLIRVTEVIGEIDAVLGGASLGVEALPWLLGNVVSRWS